MINLQEIKGQKILYVFEYFPPTTLGGAEISGKIRVETLAKTNKIVVITPNYDQFKFKKTKNNYLLIKYPSLRYFLFKKRKNISHKIIKKNQKTFSTLLLFFNIINGIEMKYWIWKINRKYGPFHILHGNNIESDLGVAFSNIKIQKVAHLRDTRIFESFPIENKWQ
ncbi:MAG: hypothetical protein KKH52_04240, partial [Nanoarchaeota archaeon]|nr:hypothetical protein [Nanoarchaeota archaeon]